MNKKGNEQQSWEKRKDDKQMKTQFNQQQKT